MRYTTIIDLRDYPKAYRNINARLVYMHLCLAAGYHDTNRDVVRLSVRTLTAQVGITMSACRHALKVLEMAKLIRRDGDDLVVKKWCESETITPRAKTAAQRQDQERATARQQTNDQAERKRDQERREREQLHAQGKNSWMVYYENRMKKAKAGSVADQDWCRQNASRYAENQRAMTRQNVS